MRAGWYEKIGEPADIVTVGEIETPIPGPGEVRVRIHVSGINPSDLKRATGWSGAPMAHPRVTPNNDGAGVIDAVGEGVATARIGERVWVYEATLVGRKQGTAAEYCILPQAYAVQLPGNADFAFGAQIGVPALTAHRCVFADGPVKGLTVLVAGGAGSVGRFAVQIAKWGGAHVIATAGSPAQMAIAKAAGAHEVLNYREPDLAARIKAAAAKTPSGGVDRVVEVQFMANVAMDAEVLKTNGSVSIYGSSDNRDEQPVVPMRVLLGKGVNLRWVMVYALAPQPRKQAIEDVTAAIAAGALTPHAVESFPLEKLADAMASVGVVGRGGKVLVEV